MKLSRIAYMPSGIFGVLSFDDGTILCQTLEHAYPLDPAEPTPGFVAPSYISKIPVGEYICQRGMHTLENSPMPFETFEVMNVPGHTGILFHRGNVNKDSEGCILLGLERQGFDRITESVLAFGYFMNKLDGMNFFKLTIT